MSSSIKILSAAAVLTDAEKIMAAAVAAEKFHFILTIGATRLSDRDGLSAAGIDGASRRLTPRLDAEALVKGCTAGGEKLPTSPLGVTSPVVLTRACLHLLDHKKTLVDAGSFSSPGTDHESVGQTPGLDFTEADSLSLPLVKKLFAAGEKAAAQLQIEDYFPILAECVPAGTTTASAVLELINVRASGMLSGSVPGDPKMAKSQKAAVVEKAISRLTRQNLMSRNELIAACLADPLTAVAFCGDPMQAYVAGIVVANARADRRPLILGGGSQMLAVYALAQAILASEKWPQKLSKTCAVVTTKWVAFDPYAETQKLAEQIGAPYVAACPDLRASAHAGLRAYEDGHVKEGVGAGAALALALQRFSEAAVIEAIDKTYLDMVEAPTKNSSAKQPA